MSAQVEDAQLRGEDAEGPREEAAEETAAGRMGAGDPTGPDSPQMNGVGGGTCEKGAGEAQASGPGPASTTFTDGPRGSGVVEIQKPGVTREAQTRTDISTQGASSGVSFAAGVPRDPGLQSALVEDEQVGRFETPRSMRSATQRSDPQQGAWQGWMARLGDMFKAPACELDPKPDALTTTSEGTV